MRFSRDGGSEFLARSASARPTTIAEARGRPHVLLSENRRESQSLHSIVLHAVLAVCDRDHSRPGWRNPAPVSPSCEASALSLLHFVMELNDAVGELLRRLQPEGYVTMFWRNEGNAFADEYRNNADDELIDRAFVEK